MLKNKPLISHIVETLPHIEIIISTNKAFEEDFLEWKKTEFPEKNIEIFIEDTKTDKEKIGALGAVSLLIKEKNIQDDVMVLAGDNFFGFSMQSFIDVYKEQPLLAVFDIQDKKRASQFGVVVSQDGKTVDAFEEKPVNPSSTLVSTGAYIFPQKNLQDIVAYAEKHNDDLGGIFEYLRSKNETIHIFSFQEKWFDVGSFQGYLDSHKELQENEILCSPSAQIQNSELKGAVSISANCQIENSILENVILFPNVSIKNSEVRNCIIDSFCEIENLDISYKIIREHSNLNKKHGS